MEFQRFRLEQVLQEDEQVFQRFRILEQVLQEDEQVLQEDEQVLRSVNTTGPPIMEFLERRLSDSRCEREWNWEPNAHLEIGSQAPRMEFLEPPGYEMEEAREITHDWEQPEMGMNDTPVIQD